MRLTPDRRAPPQANALYLNIRSLEEELHQHATELEAARHSAVNAIEARQRADHQHAAELARAHTAQQEAAGSVYALRNACAQSRFELALALSELASADADRLYGQTPAEPLRPAAAAAAATSATTSEAAAATAVEAAPRPPSVAASDDTYVPEVASQQRDGDTDSDSTRMSISESGDKSLQPHGPVCRLATELPPTAPPDARAPLSQPAVPPPKQQPQPKPPVAAPPPPGILYDAAGRVLWRTPVVFGSSSKPSYLATILSIDSTSPPRAASPPRAPCVLDPALTVLQSRCAAAAITDAAGPDATGVTPTRGGAAPRAEVAPAVLRAVAAFGLGDALALLQQPSSAHYSRGLGGAPQLSPRAASGHGYSATAASPITVVAALPREPWYLQGAQTLQRTGPRLPREHAAPREQAPKVGSRGAPTTAASPVPLHRKRKLPSASEEDPGGASLAPVVATPLKPATVVERLPPPPPVKLHQQQQKRARPDQEPWGKQSAPEAAAPAKEPGRGRVEARTLFPPYEEAACADAISAWDSDAAVIAGGGGDLAGSSRAHCAAVPQSRGEPKEDAPAATLTKAVLQRHWPHGSTRGARCKPAPVPELDLFGDDF